MTNERTHDPLAQWIRLEHARLHRVEEWPESAQKQAVLAAVHSSLARLERALPSLESPYTICATRRPKSNVVEFPCRSCGLFLVTKPAA